MKHFPASSPNTSTRERFDSSIVIFLERQADRRCIRPSPLVVPTINKPIGRCTIGCSTAEESLKSPSFEEYARELNLNVTEFSECLDTQRHTQDIFKDRIEGGNLGIRGTPGFVLFLTDMSQESEILLIPGAFPFDVFQEEIDKLLGLASQKGTSTEFPSSTSCRRSMSRHLAICHQLAYS